MTSSPRLPFDLSRALADADTDPYSALFRLRVYEDDRLAQIIEGRVNFRSRDRGRLVLRPGLYARGLLHPHQEIIAIGDHLYRRDLSEGADGSWEKEITEPQVRDYAFYAELLLRQGRGVELAPDGASVRVSGTLATAAVRKIDPATADTMTLFELEGFDCVITVGAAGRVTRFEQTHPAAGLLPAGRNTVELSAFGPAVPVVAPMPGDVPGSTWAQDE
ncbi:hypothetical protein [Streptomyces albidochromogenes]|uniref:Uncharacterized protein n=1 Tax=Streptomyces albidochromogenes TaxID=329524 RepID=A0ABW6FH37_9ACTN